MKKDTGIFQLDNGYWGYRYKIKIEGVFKESKRTFDEQGNPFKTKNSAIKAREKAIINEKVTATLPPQQKIPRKTFKQSGCFYTLCDLTVTFFDFILLQLFDLSNWRELNYSQMYELIHILTFFDYGKRGN